MNVWRGPEAMLVQANGSSRVTSGCTLGAAPNRADCHANSLFTPGWAREPMEGVQEILDKTTIREGMAMRKGLHWAGRM